MTDAPPVDLPSTFIEHWVATLRHEIARPGRALDVATGRGRHASVLAAAGFATYAVDLNPQIVRSAMDRAASHGQRVFGWCADLRVSHLPVGRFDVIVVTRYLQRDLCADLASALALNGVLLYETFTEQQRVHGRGPTSPDHLLRRGELLELFAGLETIAYEEVTEPDALSRLAARRRSNPS